MFENGWLLRVYDQRTTELYREEREVKVNCYNVAVNQVLTSEDDKNSNPQS